MSLNIINGDRKYSQDFTYIDNVIQMDLLTLSTINPLGLITIYNTAFGDKTNLNQLTNYLNELLP